MKTQYLQYFQAILPLVTASLDPPQSSVTTPPATRTEKATDYAREGAKLSARQSMTHLQRMQQPPDSGWNKGR